MMYLQRSLTVMLSAMVLAVSFAVAQELSGQQLIDLQKRLTETLKNSITQQQAEERLRDIAIYQKENPLQPFKRGIQGKIFNAPKLLYRATESSGATKVTKVLVLANKTLYEDATAKEKIDRYIQDVRSGHGCTVVLETLEGGTPPQIKEVIQGHYDNGDLNGVIQIGKLPEPWYESDRDPTTGRYDHFTIDLYYMDLDGEWRDADGNGEFDYHGNGSGDLGVEIFYGRIDATTMSTFGTEEELLTSYMDKLHNYYLGNVTLHKAALGYLDYDWRSSANYLDKIYPGSNQNELIRWESNGQTVNKDDYLNNRLQTNYSALQMWCHANYNVHGHHTGGSTSMNEVFNANPKPIAYFHDGCHVSDFAAGNGRGFLGGCYVFNESPTALLCMSGSRSGQWLGLMARVMFESMAENTCIGQAFVEWFGPYENSDEERDKQYFIGWNYGYNIFGDPMITVVEREPVGIIQKEELVMKGSAFQCAQSRGNLTVSYALMQQSPVTINLHDMRGKLVRSMNRGLQNNGAHTVNLSIKSLPNGSYVVSLRGAAMKAQKVSVINFN